MRARVAASGMREDGVDGRGVVATGRFVATGCDRVGVEAAGAGAGGAGGVMEAAFLLQAAPASASTATAAIFIVRSDLMYIPHYRLNPRRVNVGIR